MKVLLEYGGHYEATIRLGFFQAIATNQQVEAKLAEVGELRHITVTGSGRDRKATGVWLGATEEVGLPDEITAVKRIT